MRSLPLSVIMSAYNSQEYIGEAIQSILSQSFVDFEFIILDDGSTDGTLEIIKAYKTVDSRIRVISRENRGLIFSLNQLINKAKAPLIARMDADDIAHPERFAKQLEFLRSNPEYGVVGACAARIDSRGRPYRGGPSIHCPASHDEFVAAVGRGPLLVHSSVIYRKAIVLEAGGYNPAFKHCEDLGLWLELTSRTKLCSLPDELIRYRMSDTQVSKEHLVEQGVNAAILIHAWERRQEGKPDLTSQVKALPKAEELDQFFGEAGVEMKVLARVIPQILYCPRALTTDGAELIARHLAYGNARDGLWRTVMRLIVRFGEWKAALKLAGQLLGLYPLGTVANASSPMVLTEKMS